MRRFEVEFRPRAEADLLALYDYIAEASGETVAGRYIDRIEAAVRSLTTFPDRGTLRDDIAPRLRTLGFERRAAIVFRVTRTRVVIVRILYGGRDLGRLLVGKPDE